MLSLHELVFSLLMVDVCFIKDAKQRNILYRVWSGETQKRAFLRCFSLNGKGSLLEVGGESKLLQKGCKASVSPLSSLDLNSFLLFISKKGRSSIWQEILISSVREFSDIESGRNWRR